MSYAALQEGVYKCVPQFAKRCRRRHSRPESARIEGFHYGGWVTFVTTAWFCVCGGLELLLSSGTFSRKGAWRDYAVLAALTYSGMYLTNWALNYLNYSTRIVFKSSKVVPTMIVGTVLLGRRYSSAEYASAGLLVLGISMFCLGDVSVAPNFQARGVLLIVMALFADAATSNYEEKRFFRVADPVPQAEVIFCSNLLGSVVAMAVLASTGELQPALAHSHAYASVVPLLSAAAVCGYLSVTFVLTLIKHYGATNTEIVKSLRKVLSVALSFTIYPKPINAKYALGMTATVGSLLLSYRLQKRKQQLRSASPQPGAPAE